MASYPDLPDLNMDVSAATDAAALAHARRRDAARARMRNTMPPLPELRFEMAYLRSVLPATAPRKGDPAPSSAVAIAEGHEVAVNWRRVAWITIKDQVISPLFQGMFWALLSMYGGSVIASLKTGLGFPSSPKPSPGDVRERYGTAWREFARSKTGAVEAAVA